MSDKNGLLDGIRIIDLTRVLAGPYCTMMLGDLGADVIKIEVPERGDDTRHWGPPFTESGESAYFLSANRNKRSMTLNLKSPFGIKILKNLVREGDVLVENFKPGTLKRMGLDYKTMQELNPGIIYCTITGYGYSGPYMNRPGYDFIAQAIGGMMSITGPEDGDPVRVGVAITDIITGVFASNAIIASLFARTRTGESQRIDMSLLDSQVATLSYVASNYLISKQPAKRYGNGHPNIVPYQSFKTKDNFIAIAVGNDSQWQNFCNAAGHEEWVSDERFVTNEKRVENREILIPLLDDLFIGKDAADWVALCEKIGISAAQINNIEEVFSNAQVIARDRVVEVEHPTAGIIPMVASPLNIITSPPQIRQAPPTLGQHTEEILKDMLNYSDDDIKQLKEERVI
ncbi:MAG: CoA transferase [Chloroflexi bacterium]|nr:CoA transferase [Chloroflexota bacterium]